MSVETANFLWRCDDCGFLFAYTEYDQNNRKDCCPACGGSAIARFKILKR